MCEIRYHLAVFTSYTCHAHIRFKTVVCIHIYSKWFAFEKAVYCCEKAPESKHYYDYFFSCILVNNASGGTVPGCMFLPFRACFLPHFSNIVMTINGSRLLHVF